MFPGRSTSDLEQVFAEIIAGRSVKRSVHELRWENRDVSLQFAESLAAHGYVQTTVADVPVEPGERVPAFFIEEGVAYFGWIFWEKFTHLRLRKLFGSVARDDKGDWAVQISARRRSVVYAKASDKIEMDIDHPPAF